MYKRDKYKIVSNKKIAKNVYEMILEGEKYDIWWNY